MFGPADTTQIKTLSKVFCRTIPIINSVTPVGARCGRSQGSVPTTSRLTIAHTTLPQTGTTAHSDCPRFTARKDWAKYWNGDTDGTTASGEEVVTNLSFR